MSHVFAFIHSFIPFFLSLSLLSFQVIEERIVHIPTVPAQPEPFYQPTGKELKPNPVGEENGIVVFNYNPISAVNYVSW